MYQYIYPVLLATIFAPLVGAALAGICGKQIGRSGAHTVTIAGLSIAFAGALFIAYVIFFKGAPSINQVLYTWVASGGFHFNIGFMVDHLTAVMLLVVTFVSLLVHIYTIGYMADDPGYQRFFSYISLFTFFMLMLVTGNNFLQLFFGWEGVGLVSYLLIGFWFKRESANQGSLKAFLVNRVGDLGFILGIGLILDYFGSIDYATVFANVTQFQHATMTIIPGHAWSVITVMCLLLFIGAMGKSAQMPLHVWLPESMEGPTPISALIHAATMVTAGVFMVVRMSPIFEYSSTALSVVLVIGATGALITGLIGVVQTDIKRVVAYSTLSQLGYMIAATGVSAYSAGIFHLATHACFKALLFLAAGSVIIGMHHEQDMRKMGNLKKYMPITYITFLIGALSLSAIPPFSGFYSKDAIIEAVHHATIPGATFAYYCVLLGAFVTALYTFRCFFLVFHTKERMDSHTREHLKESPFVVWMPLVVLAIPSVILGYFTIGPMLFDSHSLLGSSVFVLAQHNVLASMAGDYHGPVAMMSHALGTASFWLAISGVLVAYICYVKAPQLPVMLAEKFKGVYWIIEKKFGFDDVNDVVFVKGTNRLAGWLFKRVDVKLIDDVFVNGSGRAIAWASRVARLSQTGYLYHYAFAMIIGLFVFLCWLIF